MAEKSKKPSSNGYPAKILRFGPLLRENPLFSFRRTGAARKVMSVGYAPDIKFHSSRRSCELSRKRALVGNPDVAGILVREQPVLCRF